MPQPKKTAVKPAAKRNGAGPRKVSRAEAQKAIAEMKDTPPVGDFRGVKLTLPAKLPATFIFDVAEMQADEDGTDLAVMHRLMVGLLGDDQWRAVRRKVADDGDSLDDITPLMEEMFGAVTGAYGVELGESEASATS